jgi:hypothetical protein
VRRPTLAGTFFNTAAFAVPAVGTVGSAVMYAGKHMI